MDLDTDIFLACGKIIYAIFTKEKNFLVTGVWVPSWNPNPQLCGFSVCFYWILGWQMGSDMFCLVGELFSWQNEKKIVQYGFPNVTLGISQWISMRLDRGILCTGQCLTYILHWVQAEGIYSLQLVHPVKFSCSSIFCGGRIVWRFLDKFNYLYFYVTQYMWLGAKMFPHWGWGFVSHTCWGGMRVHHMFYVIEMIVETIFDGVFCFTNILYVTSSTGD